MFLFILPFKLYSAPRGNLLPGAAHIVFDEQRLSDSQRIKDDISKTTTSLTQRYVTETIVRLAKQASGLDATKLSK